MSQELEEDIEEMDDNTSNRERWFARGYIASILLLFIGSIITLYYIGDINLSINFTASVSIGWLLEYVAIALSGLFIIFSAGMVLKATGGKTIGFIIQAIQTFMDKYEK